VEFVERLEESCGEKRLEKEFKVVVKVIGGWGGKRG
jgi:hypothetical protein